MERSAKSAPQSRRDFSDCPGKWSGAQTLRAASENSLKSLFQKTPRGSALVQQANEMNKALKGLAGQILGEISSAPRDRDLGANLADGPWGTDFAHR